jgi:hypothetical protein
VTAVITNACKDGLLDSAVAAALNGGTPHLSLHTGFPPTTGPGNELTGGSPAYARQPIAWAASSGGTKNITGTETFDVAAGTTVRAVALYDALTAGTQKCWSPAGASARRAIAVVAADLAGNTIQSPAHGLAAGNSVLFWATIGAALPTGLSEDTEYFVIAAGLTADVFSVSTTLGGSAVDITAIGDGDVQKFTPEVFAGQGQYRVDSFPVSLPG